MESSPTVEPSSFRDPRGFVFREHGRILRQVSESHRSDYDALVSSGLYDELTSDGLLIPHTEIGLEHSLLPGAYKVLEPRAVPFISYPYEWAFSAFKEAALMTLRIQQRAMRRGMTLRDASAFNVQFIDARPILIDTLSLGSSTVGQPWAAYRQFCEHFLAPLTMMALIDARASVALRPFVNGIPVDLAAALLPLRARMNKGLGLHVFLHARSMRHHASMSKRKLALRQMSPRAIEGLIASLARTIETLELRRANSDWRAYYDEADHYSGGTLDEKARVVAGWMNLVQPSTVWDLGANTGRFSVLAASMGANTVAFDHDPIVIDQLYRDAADRRASLLPLTLDLLNPSPSLGWASRERMSWFDRGPADLTLALALIHHLAVGGNVPLAQIVEMLSRVGKHVVLEWVPRDDVKVLAMMQDREDVFADYSESELLRHVTAHFEILARHRLGDTRRSLMLLRRT